MKRGISPQPSWTMGPLLLEGFWHPASMYVPILWFHGSRVYSECFWKYPVPKDFSGLSMNILVFCEKPINFFFFSRTVDSQYLLLSGEGNRHKDMLEEELVALLWRCEQQHRRPNLYPPMWPLTLLSYATLHAIPGVERRLCNEN